MYNSLNTVDSVKYIRVYTLYTQVYTNFPFKPVPTV